MNAAASHTNRSASLGARGDRRLEAAGLDAADVRKLESVQVQVGNLGTSILGLEAPA